MNCAGVELAELQSTCGSASALKLGNHGDGFPHTVPRGLPIKPPGAAQFGLRPPTLENCARLCECSAFLPENS